MKGKDGQSAVSLKVKNASGKDTATLAFPKEADKRIAIGESDGSEINR
ncbi:hypothetical protein JFL59_02745 [Histophilus somni]|nr:hypothetical protein [Histophilus somni]QQF70941.1 hypothetical protein JFL59_02745 [Histophilus somni]